MAIGESIKKGFSVTTSSWGLVGIFFAYGALTNILNIRLSERLQQAQADPQVASPALVFGGLLSVVMLLFGIFLQSGSIAYVRDKIKLGTASLGTFFSNGGKYYLRLLGFGLIVSLILVAVAAFGTVLLTLLPQSMRIVAAILTILLAAAGLYFIVLMFLAPYAIVSDDMKTVPAIKASKAIVKRNILAVLGVGLILIVIGFGLGLLSGIILGIVSAALRNSTAAPYFTAVVSAFLNAFLGVFLTATYLTLYLKLKGNNIEAAAA